jgi:hypothetical protein
MSPEPTAVDDEFEQLEANPYGVVDGAATRWITKDKRSLLISEMGDQHLLNTIRFLERQLKARHDSALQATAVVGTFNGEMASYYASGTADLAMDAYIQYATVAEPVLKGLRAEAQRRGLPELVP